MENEASSEKEIGGSPESFNIPREIRKEDIHPVIPEKGGTVLVLQVNAQDDRRNPDSSEFGALIPEAAIQTAKQAKEFFNAVFRGLSPEDRENVAVIVCASDATLKMPRGRSSREKRAMKTGVEVLKGIRESMTAYKVKSTQLLNDAGGSEGEPIAVEGFEDLNFWGSSFLEYLEKKYPEDPDLWIAYEADKEVKDKRVDMEVEGPHNIAFRTRQAMTKMMLMAREHLENHPDSRVIVWGIGMYDNIAPWLKAYVFKVNPKEYYVRIEKGGGIVVDIDLKGEPQTAVTEIGGITHEVECLLWEPHPSEKD